MTKNYVFKEAVQELIKQPLAPFNWRALLAKCIFKTPAHWAQYTVAVAIIQKHISDGLNPKQND